MTASSTPITTPTSSPRRTGKVSPTFPPPRATEKKPGRTQPGRIGPERLAFLAAGGKRTEKQKTEPGPLTEEAKRFLALGSEGNSRQYTEPGSLPDEVKKPFLGPQHIVTIIEKKGHTERKDKMGSTSAETECHESGDAHTDNGQLTLQDPRTTETSSATPSRTTGDSVATANSVANSGSGEQSPPSPVGIFHSTESNTSYEDQDHGNLSLSIAISPPYTEFPEKHSLFGASPQKDLLSSPWDNFPPTLSHDPTIISAQPAFDYAIAPFLSRQSHQDYHITSFPSPSSTGSPPSTRHSPQSPTFTSNHAEQLHPPPSAPTPVDQLSHYLHPMTTDMRARKTLVRTILIRCSILAMPAVDRKTRSNFTPLENYDKIVKVARRNALPTAQSLDDPVLIGVCWYWIGRGEAGLGEWGAATSALEQAQTLFETDVKNSRDWLPKGKGTDVTSLLCWVRSHRGHDPTQTPQGATREDLDTCWDTSEDGDATKAEQIRQEFQAAEIPPQMLEQERFKSNDWKYVNGTSTEEKARKRTGDLDRDIAQIGWKHAQKKMEEWARLWEKSETPSEETPSVPRETEDAAGRKADAPLPLRRDEPAGAEPANGDIAKRRGHQDMRVDTTSSQRKS